MHVAYMRNWSFAIVTFKVVLVREMAQCIVVLSILFGCTMKAVRMGC